MPSRLFYRRNVTVNILFVCCFFFHLPPLPCETRPKTRAGRSAVTGDHRQLKRTDVLSISRMRKYDRFQVPIRRSAEVDAICFPRLSKYTRSDAPNKRYKVFKRHVPVHTFRPTRVGRLSRNKSRRARTCRTVHGKPTFSSKLGGTGRVD